MHGAEQRAVPGAGAGGDGADLAAVAGADVVVGAVGAPRDGVEAGDGKRDRLRGMGGGIERPPDSEERHEEADREVEALD